MIKKVVLTACSDPIRAERRHEIDELASYLRKEGLAVEADPVYFRNDRPGPGEKAEALMRHFRDEETDFIFDVSGGDLANFVLPYLDYEAIRGSRALFFGYSDLSTVINAIIARTGRPAVNYQIRNVLYDHAQEQRDYLKEKILTGRISPADLECTFLRGSAVQGRVLGGNIRCFLKLAGTRYWPDFDGSILLLESLGGGTYQMMTALEQYRQMGVFEQISGVLLGTFTKMETEASVPAIEEIVMDMLPQNVPVAKTRYIGHYTDARAIVLGQALCIEERK